MSLLGISFARETSKMFSLLDVPGEKVDTSSLHITILHMDSEKCNIETSCDIMKSGYELTKDLDPFSITVDQISCFPANPKTGKYPIYLLVKSDSLNKLQKKCKKLFDKSKIDYSDNFETYSPHITLSYSDEPIKTIKIKPLEITIDHLTYWSGWNGEDDLSINFPLLIHMEKKASNKIIGSKIKNFSKIVKNI